MPTIDRRRMARLFAIALGAIVLGTSPVWGIHLGRRISWFDVRRVEVYGTRLLAAHEVLGASGVEPGQHMLSEPSVWESALAAHPVITRATVTRKLPHTLRIRVEEEKPVALVRDGSLQLATAGGAILPIEPYSVPLDLPIVYGSLADSAAAGTTRRLLAETDRLTRLDPTLMSAVSEVRAVAGSENALLLTHRSADIVIPFGVPLARIAELRRVLSDVERRFPGDGSDPSQNKHRLDLRFGDQIVVRPSSSRELS